MSADEETRQGVDGLRKQTFHEALLLTAWKALEWDGPIKIVYNCETATFEPVPRTAKLGLGEEVILAVTDDRLESLRDFEQCPLTLRNFTARMLGMGGYRPGEYGVGPKLTAPQHGGEGGHPLSN